MPWPYPTDEELAVAQQAIGDFATDFIDEHEDGVVYTGPEDGTPTDHPQHAVMVDGSPEVISSYFDGVNEALVAAGAPALPDA